MKFLFMISLRNLFRQKRRNVFLGTAMAFGVMILIIANSFSHGISDVLFNQIVAYVAGHVGISFNAGSGTRVPVFMDRERIFKKIEQTVPEMVTSDEALGVFSRAIGNGKAENLVLIGIDTSKEMSKDEQKRLEESFRMVEGNWLDIADTSVENPVIIAKEKAKTLNVKKGDIIRVRYPNVYGQSQASRLTVVGILSNSNIFMNGVIFLEQKNLKPLLGYKPHECGNIQVTLKNPRETAAGVADKLHDALVPGNAFIYGTLKNGKKSEKVTALPFMADDESKKLIADSFKIMSGKMDDVLSKEGVMISKTLAEKTSTSVGQELELSYKPKYSENQLTMFFKVGGIFEPNNNTGESTLFMNENVFYRYFNHDVPDLTVDEKNAFLPGSSAPFYGALGKEWVLLERTHTTDDMIKKQRDISSKKIKAITVDVASMYETASDVLNLEGALNLITLGAVMILFFIILIGVVNTLRMTIRERTREIGTIRAIGMQRKDVRLIFILETAFLSLMASAAGTILAFVLMGLLYLKKFNLEDNPLGMLLVNGHLNFVPTFTGVIGNILLILCIAIATAFFPAHRASKLSAAEALRHFE